MIPQYQNLDPIFGCLTYNRGAKALKACSLCKRNRAEYSHRVDDGKGMGIIISGGRIYDGKLMPICKGCKDKLYASLDEDNIPSIFLSLTEVCALVEKMFTEYTTYTIFQILEKATRGGRIPHKRLFGPFGRKCSHIKLSQAIEYLKEYRDGIKVRRMDKATTGND